MMGDKPMPEKQSGMTDDGAGDYIVEIACHQDGTYTVTAKSGEAPQGQPAKSMDEAMQIAGGMIESHKGGDDGMSVEKAFAEGFKGDEVDQPVRGMY